MDGIIIALLAAIFAGVALIRNGSRLKEWLENNKQPEESWNVRIVSKRKESKRRSSPGRSGGGFSVGRSQVKRTYFVTLQFSDESRQEYRVSSRLDAQMKEGEKGTAVLQGTRVVSFMHHFSA
ncbi:DUF2500 domain-containing protein [Bacillus daqingensis]|uniref:DUF2500 domain-containing protein n=1 Tax=Bacillus daqingensis TaxID=872396 RepID=A0ABV9NY70_9BACI